MRTDSRVATLASMALTLGCGADPPFSLSQYAQDTQLRLNHIQVLGSHNSYHVEPEPALLAAIEQYSPGLTEAWQYTHPPLEEQLERYGVRQLELDAYADPTGTRWCMHHVLPVLGRPLDGCVRPEPGFKVQHVQELDYATTCSSLARCLLEVKLWSDAHRSHVPITVLLELKDQPIPDPLGLGFVQPLPTGPAALDALDAEVRAIFPPDRLITPDDVRGSHDTLEAAVRSGTGWPTLAAARGKLMFVLLNGDLRSLYAEAHPSLRGRAMFVFAAPGEPEAACVMRDDPRSELATITELVRQGYIVRTRADADTREARSGETTRRDAALASGAQLVSTDYAVADERFGHGYQVALPGRTPARCNPVSAPAECRPEDLE